MKISELQTQIMEMVARNGDESFLMQVAAMFKSYEESGDWWNAISEEEKELIEAGMKEIDEGKGIPYEEVRKEIDLLLKKN